MQISYFGFCGFHTIFSFFMDFKISKITPLPFKKCREGLGADDPMTH